MAQTVTFARFRDQPAVTGSLDLVDLEVSTAWRRRVVRLRRIKAAAWPGEEECRPHPVDCGCRECAREEVGG